MQVGATRLVELARIAGVSVATVSRALAGNPAVSARTRDRIAAIARERGFRINQTARNLRLGRSGAVGVVLPLGHEAEQHLSDPFFMALLGPLADAVADRGYDLLLRRVIPEDGAWLDAVVDGGRVDGVVVIGQSNQIDAIEAVAARFPPLVVWGAHVPGHAQLVVGTDNAEGGRLAARHLLETGRRRLMYLGDGGVPEFALRRDGFLGVAAAAGATATAHATHLTAERAHAEIAALLAAGPPPDGIACASDVIAVAAVRACLERGLAVPADVGVIGFDDVGVAAHATPPLTTIRQDVARGASALADRLFARLGGGPAEPLAMAPTLVRRATA